MMKNPTIGTNSNLHSKNLVGNYKDNQHTPSTGGSTRREARRQQGLCYKGGDKWVYGHQCKNKQINALTVEEEQQMLHADSLVEKTQEEIIPFNTIEVIDEAISLYALSRIEVPKPSDSRGNLKRKNYQFFWILVGHIFF